MGVAGETTRNEERSSCQETIIRNVIYSWLTSLHLTIKNCLIVNFGSKRLGADTAESDVDVLCICAGLTRTFIFDTLPRFLRSQKGIYDVISIPSAYVPVIRFSCDEGAIDVDIIFCCTILTNVPFSVQSVDRFIPYVMEESDLRSLDGSLTTEAILSFVTKYNGYTSFVPLLKAVKNWAITQNVYSNQLGLFNGVSLAILCAYICARHRPPFGLRSSRARKYMFGQFFQTFGNWEWNKHAITLIDELSTTTTTTFSSSPIRIFTPMSTRSINVMHNTGIHQFRSIQQALQQKAMSIYEYTPSAFVTYFRNSTAVYFLFQTISKSEQVRTEADALVASRLRYAMRSFSPDSYQVDCSTKCFRLTPLRTFFVLRVFNFPEDRIQQNIVVSTVHSSFSSSLCHKICNLTVDVVRSHQLPSYFA